MTTPSNDTYDRIYLSPHLDDAVLSCGGQIYQATKAGQKILIVTVAAGEPETEVRSDFARFLHHNWGLTAAEAVADRRAEDIAACQILKADWLHWSLPDCIYRVNPSDGVPLYTSDADIFGEIDPSERALVNKLAARMEQLPAAGQVSVPLTLGHHVDHQLTRLAAERHFGAGLIYYEDYPYIQRHPAALAPLVTPESAWRVEVIPLSDEALAARIAASRQYRSQIGQLFNDAEGMATLIRQQVAAAGGERLWRRLHSGSRPI